MDKLRCFVLTKFNLAIDYNLNDNQIHKKIWLDENYISTRLKFFQQYCIPSLVNQTDKDFEWIVMFHSETRDYHKAIVSEIIKKYPFIHVLYLNDEECHNYMSILADYIQTLVKEDEYITTRIDNDDMYHPTYIEEVKKQFETLKAVGQLKTRHVVSYPLGIQYNVHTNDVLRLEWDCNHFLALYCKKSEKAHILMYNHTQIRKHYSNDCFKLITPPPKKSHVGRNS